MAIRLEDEYPGKVEPASDAYPQGAARNVTVSGDGTGTPLEAAWLNDNLGFQQAILALAGVDPSGVPDTAEESQYLDALLSLITSELVGLVDVVGINNQTGTSYTTVLDDAGSLIITDNADANTITIPPDMYLIGSVIAVRQKGTGQTTIVEGAGVTIVAPSSKGLLLSEQGEVAALVQESINYWSVTGGLTA